MAIYTKTGDKGMTGLIGGKRVPKFDPVVCALGDLDELNAWIGVLRMCAKKRKGEEILKQVQDDIYLISAKLANACKKPQKAPAITPKNVHFLEQHIDALEKRLPRLEKFIPPGGKTQFHAFAHVARTVCRRAERNLAALNRQRKINPQILVYTNRLSDLLFMLARLR